MKTKKKSNKPTLYKGLPLIDATRDLDIEIRKGDVSTAKKKDPASCAAANAASRILKTEVEVHMSRIYIKDGEKWVRYETPNRMQKEIISFDRGAAFEPGDYKFKAPMKSHRLGAKRRGGHKTGTGKSKRAMHATMNVRERADVDKGRS